MSCPDSGEAEAAAPTLPPAPAPGPAPPRAATVVTADSADGGAKQKKKTDTATTPAPAKNMGKELAKANFKFPDYSDAKPNDFNKDPGNLIGKILIFEQNTGQVSERSNVNWYTTRTSPTMGDGNCIGGCSSELDFSEGNNCGLQLTIHVCSSDGNGDIKDFLAKATNPADMANRCKTGNGGSCDGFGCYTRAQNEYAMDWYEEGAEKPADEKQDMWGPGQYIDATKWHEIAWYFVDKGGDIDAIWVRLKQDKKVAVVPVCTDEIMGKDQKVPDGWSKQYLKMFSKHLKAPGWRVQHTKWGEDQGMDWLAKYRDGNINPHCGPGPQKFPGSAIGGEGEHFKNIRVFTPSKNHLKKSQWKAQHTCWGGGMGWLTSYRDTGKANPACSGVSGECPNTPTNPGQFFDKVRLFTVKK
eukprot:g15852.t1